MNPPKRPNSIAASVTACLLLLGLNLASSCVVTTVEDIGPDASPRKVVEKQSWDAVQDGKIVGHLKLLDILDPAGLITMYHVSYADGQQAGWIDLQGRAFRDEPFKDGLVLVGMDPMRESLRRLLDLEFAPVLLPAARRARVAQN